MPRNWILDDNYFGEGHYEELAQCVATFELEALSLRNTQIFASEFFQQVVAELKSSF